MLDYIISKIRPKKKAIQIKEPQQDKAKKLKEINYQLDSIYFLIKTLFEDFQKHLGITSANPEFLIPLTDTDNLKKAVEKIENENGYGYEIDPLVLKNQRCFFGSSSCCSTMTLERILEAIQSKINELKDEKRKNE